MTQPDSAAGPGASPPGGEHDFRIAQKSESRRVTVTAAGRVSQFKLNLNTAAAAAAGPGEQWPGLSSSQVTVLVNFKFNVIMTQ